MKKTKDGFRAHELELIVAPDADGFNNRKLYVLEGEPGIYRRLTVEDSKDNPLAIKAWFDGGIIPLTRVERIETELWEAGFHSRWPDCCAVKAVSVSFHEGDIDPRRFFTTDKLATVGAVSPMLKREITDAATDLASDRCSVVPDQQRLIEDGKVQSELFEVPSAP